MHIEADNWLCLLILCKQSGDKQRTINKKQGFIFYTLYFDGNLGARGAVSNFVFAVRILRLEQGNPNGNGLKMMFPQQKGLRNCLKTHLDKCSFVLHWPNDAVIVLCSHLPQWFMNRFIQGRCPPLMCSWSHMSSFRSSSWSCRWAHVLTTYIDGDFILPCLGLKPCKAKLKDEIEETSDSRIFQRFFLKWTLLEI